MIFYMMHENVIIVVVVVVVVDDDWSITLSSTVELELVELVVVVELVAELLPESTSFVDDCSIANLVVVVVVVVAVAVVPTVKLTVV